MKHLLKGLVLAGVSILLGHGAAQAHKVTIFAWAEGDRVFTESKFSGGKRVKGGTVTVFDPAGNQLLEGRTDDRGEYSFKVPTADGLTVVLNAGMGHGNSWTLSAAELGGAGGEPDRPMPERIPAEPPAAQQADAGGLSAAEVEAIVARQLDRKLQPLTRMLAAAQEKGPTIGDVVGGLGYIIGLVGLGAYVRYRKESRVS